jgi:hypothetical protein
MDKGKEMNMYQGQERRVEFRCACGDRLSFGFIEWNKGKAYYKCTKCNGITEAKRKEDYGKFREAQRDFNEG